MSEKQETHTPEPWELVQERDYLNLQEKDTNLVIAQFMGASDEDARLMARAPELLEQCKQLKKIIECRLPEMDAHIELQELCKVLAKVEGETA